MSEYFKELLAVNVNGHTEQKKSGNTTLTYLSWPFAWAEVKKRYPDATYQIEKFDNLPYVLDPKTGYMVFTSVTINGDTHEMWLPVMDGANKAMKDEPYDYLVKNPNHKYANLDKETGKWLDRYGNEQPEYITKHCDAATMFDVNKAIMRCLVKNLAMFGLGLYIYAGEDLPIVEEEKEEKPTEKPQKSPRATKKAEPKDESPLPGEPVQNAMNEPTDRERMMAAYPSRDEMIVVCKGYYKGQNLARLYNYYKVTDFEDLTDEQVITCYNTALKGIEKQKGETA